jgi:hypothetical protein
MLLKTTWVPGLFLYPLIVALIVFNYGKSLSKLAVVDLIVLSSGLVGALLSGYTIKVLRTRGYRMF